MGGVRLFLIFWWERLLFSGRRGKITVALKRHMIEYPPVAKLDIAADSDSEGRGFESLRAGQMCVKFHTACSFFALFMGGLNLKGFRREGDGILGNGRLCRAANIEISLGLAVVARGYFSGRLLIQRKKPLEKGNCRVQGMEDVALYCAKEKKADESGCSVCNRLSQFCIEDGVLRHVGNPFPW